MRKLGLIIVLGVALLVGLPGCSESYSCCGSTYYYYVCAKGSDTVIVYIAGAASTIQAQVSDSLNFYENLGFSVITNNYGAPWQAATTCAKGGPALRRALAAGQGCFAAPFRGDCGGDDYCGAD